MLYLYRNSGTTVSQVYLLSVHTKTLAAAPPPEFGGNITEATPHF